MFPWDNRFCYLWERTCSAVLVFLLLRIFVSFCLTFSLFVFNYIHLSIVSAIFIVGRRSVWKKRYKEKRNKRENEEEQAFISFGIFCKRKGRRDSTKASRGTRRIRVRVRSKKVEKISFMYFYVSLCISMFMYLYFYSIVMITCILSFFSHSLSLPLTLLLFLSLSLSLSLSLFRNTSIYTIIPFSFSPFRNLKLASANKFLWLY